MNLNIGKYVTRTGREKKLHDWASCSFVALFIMNSISFIALIVVALVGLVSAKNNYFVKTYFNPGSNCTHASGKAQEKDQMNICSDTMHSYVDGRTGYVTDTTFSDYKCTTQKSSISYQLSVCQKYDSNTDVYPTAF